MVKWYLPASKTDTKARGVARAHGCSCTTSAKPSCPYHAVLDQLDRLRRLFPDRWSSSGPADDLPLFPAEDGSVVTKDRMVATIVEAARRLHVPLEAPDGSARVSGHSLRVTGAQGLAKAGLDVWAIQLLGRWGSAAVLGYIREVPLELAATWAAKAAHAMTLEEVMRRRSPSAAASSSSASASTPLIVPEALVAPLAEAVAAEVVAELPLSASSFVVSPGGRWHRLSHRRGLGNFSAGWTAACGWDYTGPSANIAVVLPTALCHKYFCARCLPELRARLKAGS